MNIFYIFCFRPNFDDEPSNPRPNDCEPFALPTELQPLNAPYSNKFKF